MKNYLLLCLAFTFSWSALAVELKFEQSLISKDLSGVSQEKYGFDEKYHTIGSIDVTEIDDVYIGPIDKNNNAYKGIGEIIIMTGKLIALGKEIWKIVEAGKPVINTNFVETISVLPNVKDPKAAFSEMENWSMPKVKTFRVSYKNLWGSEVVSFTYGVYYQHGGQYEGKGRYLTGINVDAQDVRVGWGFTFDASSSLVALSNRGSNDDPNAGVTMKINYIVKSAMKEIRSSESFHLTGKGQFAKLR